MDRHQLRLAALKICIPFLLVFSWVSASLVLETRPQRKTAVAAAPEGASAALSSLARLPASLPSSLPGVFAASPAALNGPRMELLRVSCWDVQEKSQLQSEARWVRLSGETCLNEFKPDSIRVKNLTNGYVATTFRPENGQLTTDYIPLESGKNDLLVRFEQGDGVHSENHITVTR